MQVADPTCCLSRKGSIHDKRCIVYEQRMEIMSKASWLRGNEKDGQSCAGRSLLEMLEDQLDEDMNFLMAPNWYEGDDAALNRCKGRAEGMALAIAIIKAPYFPNIDAAKGQAVSRYEERQAEIEVEDVEGQ